MEYKTRLIEANVRNAFAHFPAVSVVGARQVGKTSLINHLFSDQIRIVTFDPSVDVGNARQDPDLFIQNNPPPLFLDEVQYAPEVLGPIKRRIDREGRNGMYLLSGSQNLFVLKSIAESLAGRVSVQHLWPMAHEEVSPVSGQTSFLEQWTASRGIFADPGFPSVPASPPSLTDCAWRGGMPRLLTMPDNLVSNFMTSYLQTYIERDIRTVADIGSLQTFRRFVGILAALSAAEINPAEIGRELGVARNTAAKWVEIAESTFQWTTVPAYSRNAIKRLSGKRKGYFTDTGLLCALLQIPSPQALQSHPMLGHIVETYLAMEVIKRTSAWSLPPAFFHFRSAGGAEVDLIAEVNGTLFPFEIKATSQPGKGDARGFRSLRECFPGSTVATGLVICAIDRPARISDDAVAVPWWMV
jgi:hypothetical protein